MFYVFSRPPRRSSTARMMTIVNASQAAAVHVRVDLRGRQVRMSKHFLDAPQVSAALHQVGGKRMPQLVRRQRSPDANRQRISPQELPESLTGERLRPLSEEKRSGFPLPQQKGPSRFQIRLNLLDRHAPQWHQALLSSLPGDQDVTRLKIEIIERKACQLTHPQAGAIEQLDHRAVPHPLRVVFPGAGQQMLHFLQGQENGESRCDLRALQVFGGVRSRVFLGDQEAVKAPQRGQVARLASLGQTEAVQVPQVLAHVLGTDLARLGRATAREGLEVRNQISSVGFDGFVRESALGAQIADEQIEEREHLGKQDSDSASEANRPQIYFLTRSGC